MSDNRVPGSPSPRDEGGWRVPAEEPAPSHQSEGSWHVPSPEPSPEPASEPAEGWYIPGAKTSPPPEEAAVALPGNGDLPAESGGWHSPDAVVAVADTEEAAGWHVPLQAQARDILAGVADTVYPIPEEAEAPAEETPLEEPGEIVQFEGAIPVSARGAEPEGEVIHFDGAIPVEQQAPASGQVQAAPAAADSPAAVAAAKVAELERQGQQGTGSQVDETTPPPGSTAPLTRLVAQFDNVEEQVHRLRDQNQRGEITRDQLQNELRKLMILDERGVWWMIGVESDKWYRYQDGQWAEAQRPRLRSQTPTETGVMPVGEVVSPGGSTAYIPLDQAPRDTIQLDENNMPIVRRVPRVDPEATIVGASAVRFGEDTVPSDPAMAETAARVSLADAAQQTMPHQAASIPGPRVITQPDYSAAPAAPPSDLVRKAQEAQAAQRRGCIIRAVVLSVVGVLVLGLVVIVGSILFYQSKVAAYDEQINSIADLAGQFQTTRIYDSGGNLLSQVNDPTGGTRISIPLDEISPFLLHATVAIENERFYQDAGWDPIAIVRGVLQNVSAGGQVVSGASTITQQLARILVLPERRTEITNARKIDEVIIAAEIGRRYTKSEILELYLNEIYFGHMAYGAEAAAQTYFGISARDLNLPQAAFLVGLVGSPATFDPINNREAAFDRMAAVLDQMVEIGCITFEHTFTFNNVTFGPDRPFCVTQDMITAAVVQRAEVEVRDYSMPANNMRYPHFVNYVMQQLEENYGLTDIYRAGFNVYTTLVPTLQDAAQQSVSGQIAALQQRGIGGNNASVVVMDPRNGYILAMVGSADFNNEAIDGQVNVAFTPQQPGSSIKPLVYVTAFQPDAQNRYWTPATIVWDTPTCWSGYCPRNYSGLFSGPQPVRVALASSLNIPAVKTMEYITPDRFAANAQAMGLTFPGNTPQQAGLPGAIGAFDVRLYDMVIAFGVFANNGRRVDPVAITRITDNDGNEIPLPARPEPVQVIQPEHAYLINSILSDEVARQPGFGPNSILNVPGYTVAVKTGTSGTADTIIDNWTVGYTPSVVVGVWHGNTDNSPMRGTTGVTGAAPIWNEIMRAALQGQPAQEFPVPAGITTVEICSDTGALPSQECINRRIEVFAAAQPPPQPDQSIFRRLRVNTLTGLLANDFCPNFVEERVFVALSDPTGYEWINNTAAGRQWAAQRGIPLPVAAPPTQACNASGQQPVFSLDWPIPNAVVQGLVEIRGRVQVANFNRYQIEYGVGQQPQGFSIVDGPYTIQHPNSELLGRWDVSRLQDGIYTVRLSVITNDGGYAVIDHVVNVDNPEATATFIPATATATPTQPPIVVTITPTPGVVTMTPTTAPVSTALPAHNPATDIVVGYGMVATGVITNAQPATFYRFDGQAGETVQITVNTVSGNLDPLVFLLNASDQIVSSDDDGAGDGTTNSLLRVQLTISGTYTIAVTRFNIGGGTSEGQYQMTLTRADGGGGGSLPPVTTLLPPPVATTTPLVYGAVADGIIANDVPGVYYRFDGQAGETIEISATNRAGDLDTVILLLDAAGTQIAEDDDGGEGTNSLLRATLPATGSYTIVVTRFEYAVGISTGEFRMTLNRR